jgi:hypothetical protein
MPDKSSRRFYQEGLKGGRAPADVRAEIPYRIEEAGRGGRVLLPKGLDGPHLVLRGRPPPGRFLLFIGDQVKLPSQGQVIEQGKVFTKEEA